MNKSGKPMKIFFLFIFGLLVGLSGIHAQESAFEELLPYNPSVLSRHSRGRS